MNIIVTGASRGIGYSLVKLFSNGEDNRILAVSRNRQKLEQLKSDCKHSPAEVIIADLDLTGVYARESLLKMMRTEFQNVDILINNAGVLINKEFEELTDADFTTLMDTNLRVPVNLIKWLLPYFSKQAHIVNIGSMGGVQGSVKFPGLSLYSASKGALSILTECLAEEFKDSGLIFNCLALGSAQTEMLAEAFPGYKAPLTSDEMAGFIAEFAVNGSKYFNGKVLPVAITTP